MSSYSSIPTEPENATTAIQGRRYSEDTPKRIFETPNNDSPASTPPLSGAQLRRSSKIRHLSGEIKRQSIISKYLKLNSINIDNENEIERPKPQHIKIVMPLPSQLSEDFKNDQKSFSTDSNNNKTMDEIWKMPWVEEEDNKFSKKFWLVLVISLLILFGFLIIGFGVYAYFTYAN